MRDLTAPLLLVLGPLAGALLAAAVLWSDRPTRQPTPWRFTLPAIDLPDPGPLPDWITWRPPTVDQTPTMVLPWRRHPLASDWPEPPEPRFLRQTTALTASVARAWDQQGADW